MSAEADTTVHAHLVVILNECLLSAAKSGDIPRLQVLRCVLGPIRALTDPGAHSEVAELGCRSCCDLCDLAPMSRIETGALTGRFVATISPPLFPLADPRRFRSEHSPCAQSYPHSGRQFRCTRAAHIRWNCQ